MTNLGFESELWRAANTLRGSMDAAEYEYKHVVLGLIFLKYISDAFEEHRARLEAERAEGADPEDPDEYRAANVFWVLPEARWAHLKAQAKQPTIGQLVDAAMAGIERNNPTLKGVLPRDYARPALDKQRLGQLIDLVSNIDFRQPSPRPRGHPSPRGRGAGGEVLPLAFRPHRGHEERRALARGQALEARRAVTRKKHGNSLKEGLIWKTVN